MGGKRPRIANTILKKNKLGHEILDTTPKARCMKERIDKLDFTEIKNFCSMEESHYQENKKISQRLGETICKRPLLPRTIKNI